MPLPFSGYLRKTRKNIPGIIDFIKLNNPDLVGLIEVDGGSRRSQGISQAKQIADVLGHYHIFKTKYKTQKMLEHIPIVRKQGNAFLAKEKILDQRYHYFERGIKKLIIEVEFEKIIFFLVHLSIRGRRRKEQLNELGNIVNRCEKPVVVGGDFNVFSGTRELEQFLADTGLKSANPLNIFTFPSRKPRWELDFIFYSPEITVNQIQVPDIRLSDHLPIVCDFTITREEK